jgi:hypothetical protein
MGRTTDLLVEPHPPKLSRGGESLTTEDPPFARYIDGFVAGGGVARA